MARIEAANILLEGSVNVEMLTVRDVLALGDNGAFAAFKSGPEDSSDGLFVGKAPDGEGGQRFVLSATRTATSGVTQEVSLTNAGFVQRNARFFVTGDTAVQTAVRTTNLGKSALPTGISRIKLSNVRGGGGGGNGGGNTAGTAGGNTIVKLYDGATLKRTVTSAGGAAGTMNGGRPGGNEWSGARGQGTTIPTSGGDGGAGSIIDGTRGSAGSNGGLASGGGGGGGYRNTRGIGGGEWEYYSNPVGGKGGAGSAAVTTEWIDVSGWASPQIEITIGAGGAGGAQSGTYGGKGGDGGADRVEYQYSVTSDIPADVVPLKPTATGTFAKGTGGGLFPLLGPGLWVIWNTGSGELQMDGIHPGEGISINAYNQKAMTFFASVTPNYDAGGAARTIGYAFYSMGSWGQ